MNKITLLIVLLVICSGCANSISFFPSSAAKSASLPKQFPDSKTKAAVVSFYHSNLKGLETANGEFYEPSDFTAAHANLPFGTKVQFFNTKNDTTVTVRINDRGPNVNGRDFDLSYAAAKELGLTEVGVAILEYRVLALSQ